MAGGVGFGGAGACMVCGSAPATRACFRLVTSFVVWATIQSFEGALCRRCGLAVFRRLQLRTLMLGWWSLIGLPLNVLALAGNLRSRHALTRLPAPVPATGGPGTPMMPLSEGPPLWRRPGMLVAPGIALALGLTFAVVVAARAQRDEDGTVVKAGDVSVMTLAEGDCIDLFEGEAQEVHATRCDEPHDAEVLAVLTHPDTGFPSEQERVDFVGEHCLALFRTYVGREYAYSELDVTWLEPTPSGWALGDRGFTCLAVPLDGSKLTGSVRGSGR